MPANVVGGMGRTLFLLAILQLLTGCETFLYYGQAAKGQLSLVMRRKPIEKVLEAPDTPPLLANRLRLALRLREFAEEHLHLPAGGNYLGYVALDAPYVIWNVFAAPEFSLEPETWCYPVVGCAAYRGYFSREDAERYADELREKGLDVYAGGITAYSTLGWFDDPVLSTFVYYEEAALARLLFHELAHRLLYVPGDSTFSESFATAVELAGVRRWMEMENKREAHARFLEEYGRRRQVVALVMAVRRRLEALYAEPLAPEEKRWAKAAIIEEMRSDYRAMRRGWGGYDRYDGWFGQPINNAQLNTISTYYAGVPAFQRILEECGGELACFYEECRRLAELPAEERTLAITGSPGGEK